MNSNTWQERLDNLLTDYDTTHHSEAATVAEHIREVMNSNDINDPDLKAYILASLKELADYTQQAIEVLQGEG